jgi:hypothetical protein
LVVVVVVVIVVESSVEEKGLRATNEKGGNSLGKRGINMVIHKVQVFLFPT